MDERGAADGEESPPEKSGATASAAPASVGATATLTGQRNWQPNEEYMLTLMNTLGISRNAAEKALFYTANRSPDLAAAWIFENTDANLETPLDVDGEDGSDDGGMIAEIYKMVFVVNTGLEMGVGKIAAQVAHAALGIHRLLLQDENKYGTMMLDWEELGETKIVLRGTNTQQLVELEKRALSLNLPTYLVQDAGRTQIPAGSTTVLCLMGRLDLVDQVTGSLKLL